MTDKYTRAYNRAFKSKKSTPLRKMMLFSTFRNGKWKEMCKFVDKVEVRNTWIGKEYIFPKILFEIDDLNNLPKLDSDKQFVLKCSGGSGGVQVFKGSDFDKKMVKSFIRRYDRLKNFWKNGELQYAFSKNVFYVEEFLEEMNEIKIHVFDDYVIPSVIPNRHQISQRFAWDGEDMKKRCNYLHGKYPIEKYSEKIIDFKTINKAIEEAKKIQKKFGQYVRVDFIISKNKMYFGEVTFTHNAGYIDFNGDDKMLSKFIRNYEKTNNLSYVNFQ